MPRNPPPPNPDALDSATSAPPTDRGAPHSEPQRSPTVKLVLVLGAMVALGPLTIDLYLPALPDIEVDLNTSAAQVQLTLTATLVGLALGQLIVGPMSDTYGRRAPLIYGTAIHVSSALACLFVSSIEVLALLRVFQGFGAASTAVVTMAIVRDLYSGTAAARLLSRLMLVLGVAPILAPSLGGIVLRWTNWRGIFVLLAMAGLGMMALARFAIEETLPRGRRRRSGVFPVIRTYWRLAHDLPLMGLTLAAGFAMGAMFSYVSGSSFVLQDQYGLNAQQFGFVFGGMAVFLIGGTQLNGRLVNRHEPYDLLLTASGVAVGTSLLLTLSAWIDLGLVGFLIPLGLTMAALGTAMPNAPAIALSRHGEAAGTAAAMLGAARFIIGAAVAPLVGVLGNDAVAMAIVMAGCLLLALVALLVLAPRSAITD